MAAHRYWRINILKRVGTPELGSVSLGEVELRTSEGGADVTAPGMPCYKSGGYGAAANAIDNDMAAGHSWDSWDQVCPAWWSVDLGAGNEKDIVEVAIAPRFGYAQGEAPKDFNVEFSDDNVNWTVKASFTGASGYADLTLKTFSFAPLAIVSITPNHGPDTGGTRVRIVHNGGL